MMHVFVLHLFLSPLHLHSPLFSLRQASAGVHPPPALDAPPLGVCIAPRDNLDRNRCRINKAEMKSEREVLWCQEKDSTDPLCLHVSPLSSYCPSEDGT